MVRYRSFRPVPKRFMKTNLVLGVPSSVRADLLSRISSSIIWLFNNSSVCEEYSQLTPDGTDWTHVEDLKDLLEILVPGSNHIFLILGVNESRE